MYQECGDAVLKGSRIKEIYLNGEQFCKGRRYDIGDLNKDNCFHYKIELLTVSKATYQRRTFGCVEILILFLVISWNG
jgi:hypothetical protein